MFFRIGDWVEERTLVHGQELVLLLGQSNQLVGFLSGGGEGLLADDCCKKMSALMRSQLLHVAVWKLTVLSIFEGQLGQGVMRIGSGGDDHHLDTFILDHLLGGPVGLDSRVVLLGIVIGFRGALHNSGDFELRDFLNEGNVEGLGTEAITHNSDVPGL